MFRCALILLGSAVALWGCTNGPSSSLDEVPGGVPGSAPNTLFADPTFFAPTSAQPLPPAVVANRQVQVQFDLLRAQLPIGSVRHSRKIWNHVDELRNDSDVVALLARNGLRVGAGSASSWPAIRAILESCDATVSRRVEIISGDVSLAIDMGVMNEPETVFSHDRAGRLSGKTIQPGERRLLLEYLLHPELGGSTDINLVLEIRRNLNRMEWRNEGGVVREVPAFRSHRFDDLSILLTLNPGEFLVIGPNADADNQLLVGNRFFVGHQRGKSFETVLFITPQNTRRPVSER